jgi:hypothetical protein
MAVTEIITQLFVIFVAAKLAGEAFIRLKQSPIIGERRYRDPTRLMNSSQSLELQCHVLGPGDDLVL